MKTLFVRGVLMLGLVLVGCDTAPVVIKQQFYSFGTIVEVSLWGVKPQQAQSVFLQLQEDMDYMHETWHAWHEGPLARINQLLPLGATFSVAPSVLPLIENCKLLYRKSHGLFNPAIGGLINLWGFAQDEPPLGPPPADEALRPYLETPPSMDDIELDGIRMRSKNPLVQLNFGGYAKGYAVDILIQRMQESGVRNGIVNAGGDLRAIGMKGDRPWRIAIRDPRGEGILASLAVQGDESVFTSGNYERFFTFDGQRFHHIIDPRTGYPAQGSVSVTVIHNNAAEADAAATAIFVAGPRQWPEIAAAMGVTQVMVVDDAMHVYMTPSMAERVHFEIEPLPAVTIQTLP